MTQTTVADLILAAQQTGYAEGFHDFADTLLDTLPGMAEVLDRSARDLCLLIRDNGSGTAALTADELDGLRERAAFDLGAAHMARDITAVIRTALDLTGPVDDAILPLRAASA